jgi:ketosteroid isomerase-like protein
MLIWNPGKFSNGGRPNMQRTTSIAILLISLTVFYPPQAQTKNKSAVGAIKQLEQQIGDAMVARDIEKLNQFYGGDWVAIGYSGKVIDKQTFLSDFKSSRDTLELFKIGPMDVQVFGNVAVAHASVTEKRILDGKDTSGEFIFMDLLENRAGKWVVVRTAGARIK